MLLTFGFLLMLGAGGQALRIQRSPGLQPHVMKVQPGPTGGFRFFQRGFLGFGYGRWPRRLPQPTRGVSPPLPPPPAHLPLLNLPPGREGPDVLLAFRNGSIFAVRAYRIEGEFLRYRTNYGAENTIALSMLDVERTRKLNADCQVPFQSP